MNIKEFFKRDNLDEMQKQTLLKIESRGFWVLWVLLLAALIIESLLGFAPREMAAEWFIFMLGCAYSVLSDLRAGIWDRHLKANTKTNAAVSVAGGVAVFVWGLIKFAEFGMGVAVLQAVIMGICTWVLCFALLQHSWAEYLAYWRTSAPWVMAVVLVPNFFLSFLPFFGEEYGWRYYLTPALQGRFGARRGALAVGVLWGLPLNLFFYSPDTSLQSIAAQLVVCVTLGVFFTFAYEKCGKNIWLPVVLHYLNNSMVLVWTGTADISNQIISWTDVAISAIMYGVVFLPFLAAKCYRKNK